MLRICKEDVVNKLAGKSIKGVARAADPLRRANASATTKKEIARNSRSTSADPLAAELLRDVPSQLTANGASATADSIWSASQEMLRNRLNSDIYNLWFAPIRACDLQNE